ncbi:MAG: hypothetical protein AABX28_01015 [Nanoarchaeota archaeon]|mgnify:CR=1 FL=1
MFSRKKNKDSLLKDDAKYPLEELERHVGKAIEVHYLDQNKSRIERAVLRFPPCQKFFYIGTSERSFHIVYWDKLEHNGKRSIVRLIKDTDDNIIYENKDIPFDMDATSHSF